MKWRQQQIENNKEDRVISCQKRRSSYKYEFRKKIEIS